MNLGEITWKNDGHAMRFVERHVKELSNPRAADPWTLATASLHCIGENPFSEELCRRAGLLDLYKAAMDDLDRMRATRKAAARFGIVMCVGRDKCS
ncbi:MAG: hypothetical protein IJP98_02380 [Clostridia bacterium]|nr:hypothetical protein [Clostridia bacterium]